jgi:hypothetical protein
MRSKSHGSHRTTHEAMLTTADPIPDAREEDYRDIARVLRQYARDLAPELADHFNDLAAQYDHRADRCAARDATTLQ